MKIIKKVRIDFPYGCYSTMPEDRKRISVAFTENKITYFRKPCIGATKANPYLKIEYQTNNKDNIDPFYTKDFFTVCKLAEDAIKDYESSFGHTYMCDVMPPNLLVEYEDGEKKKIRDVLFINSEDFEEIAEKYLPDEVKDLFN